jgi:hypothetical protein
MFEDASGGVALVSEARLKPNDPTLPGIGQQSLTGILSREHIVQL